MEGQRRVGRPADYTGLDLEIVRSLEFLGLTAYEIKVYLTILEHPQIRVPDIARLAKVPQPKVYATIKRLTEHGMLESHLGPVNRYSVIDPDHGFGPLLKESDRRDRAARESVGRLRKQYLASDPASTRRGGRVKLFQSRPAATRSFRDRITRLRDDLVIVVRWPLTLLDYSGEIADATARGSSVRMLCEVPEHAASSDRLEFVDRMRKAGATLRRTGSTPLRVAIFDGEVLILPMSDPTPHEGDGFMMLEVRNPQLSQGFLELFEGMWTAGQPI
jgi:sugar-specific transcriptional regulator TrmB